VPTVALTLGQEKQKVLLKSLDEIKQNNGEIKSVVNLS